MSAVLGLLYGTVDLAPYTPEWARLFSIEARRLRMAVAHLACEIEHVGSTAVPGLAAKPIIDVAIGTPNREASQEVISALQELGYIYRGDGGATGGGHILVLQSAPWVRTHHVHVVELSDPQWSAYLGFRDYLRTSPKARERYLAAKTALAALHATNRKAYTAAKAAVVRELLADAGFG